MDDQSRTTATMDDQSRTTAISDGLTVTDAPTYQIAYSPLACNCGVFGCCGIHPQVSYYGWPPLDRYALAVRTARMLLNKKLVSLNGVVEALDLIEELAKA